MTGPRFHLIQFKLSDDKKLSQDSHRYSVSDVVALLVGRGEQNLKLEALIVK